MAVIHRTTMSPTKVELLAGWLPGKSWYVAGSGAPQLTRTGGFRLDDPQGEVGMEFMVVTDTSGGRPVSYHLPLTYRGAPLEAAEQGLIGTSEHGVLGTRWVYDGAHDPVLVAQLLALFQGSAVPQAQNESDTPDPTVVPHLTGSALPDGGLAAPLTVRDGADGTDVTVGTSQAAALRVVRALVPDEEGSGPRPAGTLGHLTAPWHPQDGTEYRGTFAVITAAPSH
ncbi:maltokinase N-terminal cap-like domain-containing protein (plasmid) [Streptomyces sp. CA-294286]|uniref:maltokinase N-terminal cap-like domain-containing protein n=1 Tax=Streptomyces sp. CA-294286 TaxID=3240070 RepID=UPI003D94774B